MLTLQLIDPTDMPEDERGDKRKANKPLMEKRRRARINKSLLELKSILVESMKKSAPGHSKWEKADILEMTVQYLQCLRNQQQANKSDPLAVGQFIAGFSECVRQVQKFGIEENKTNDDMQHKLTDFLLSYLKNFSDDATQTLSRHSPRLKTVSSSPVPEHSPTGSSLSPKSLSPASSVPSSPRKSDTVLTLLMPQSSYSSAQGTQNNLLQQLQLPSVNLIEPGAYALPKSSPTPVWRPW